MENRDGLPPGVKIHFDLYEQPPALDKRKSRRYVSTTEEAEEFLHRLITKTALGIQPGETRRVGIALVIKSARRRSPASTQGSDP